MRLLSRFASGFHARMFLVLSIAIIPIFAGLCVYAYHERNEIVNVTRRSTQSYVDLVAQHENRLLEGYEQALATIAATRVVQDRDWPGCNRYFAQLVTTRSPYVNLGVIGADGRILCSAKQPDSITRMNLSDRPYFHRALNNRGFIVSDYLKGRISNLPTLAIASAIEMRDGGSGVVLFAALDLRELARAEHNVRINKDAHLTIVDRNDTILFSSERGLAPGEKLAGTVASFDAAATKSARTDDRPDTKWFIARAQAGTTSDPSALSILYEYPAMPLMSAVDREFWAGIGILLVLSLLALVAGWKCTQALIGRDVKCLVLAAKRLRGQDFTGRLTGKVTGREFTEIAEQFDKMSEALQFREQQWETAVRKQAERNTILQRVARNQPLDETLLKLVAFAQEHIATSVAAIVLLRPGTRRISQCLTVNPPAGWPEELIGLDVAALPPLRNPDRPKGANDAHGANDTGAANDDLPLEARWTLSIDSSDATPLGALAFYYPHPHRPTEDESEHGRVVADLAALAIDRDRTARALIQSESEYRLLFETNPHPMWIYNIDTLRVIAANNQAIEHYGYSHAEFLHMRLSTLVMDSSPPPGGSPINGSAAIPNLIAQTHRKKNHEDILVEAAYFPLHFMGQEAMLALIHDVTEQRQHSEALQYQARHDIVTGLLNRASFSARVDEAIASTGAAFYIVVMGLNEFREINTALGYAVGDTLLKETGTRIKIVAGSAPVARVGSDEFAMLLDSGTYPASMPQTLRDLLATLKRPFEIAESQIQMTACLGISQYPTDGRSTALLLQHANSALFQARQESSGYAFYEADNDHLAPERVLLSTQLLRGLDEHRFELYYQPKIPLRAGLAYGFEALARWHSPDQGLATPDRFMAVIESSELIHPFTIWVLNTAVEECAKWHASGYFVTVAANVSARNLLDSLLAERIRQILTRHALAPQYLELEITESSIMSNPERSLNVLRKIHDIGVGIVIDDFGTGYSSLAYLQKLPVDSLKIDRSFVVEMDRNGGTRPIVNSIIEMAHSLNVSVTAEGIESRQTMAKLAGMNCDYAQGYHISQPMAAEHVPEWLRRNIPDTQLASEM